MLVEAAEEITKFSYVFALTVDPTVHAGHSRAISKRGDCAVNCTSAIATLFSFPLLTSLLLYC